MVPALEDFPETPAVEKRIAGEFRLLCSRANGSVPPLGCGPRTGLPNIWAKCGETDERYLREGLGHPGVLQRIMNKVLVDNAILGPWIHVGSRMQLLAAASVDDELVARAKVTGNYEKKGHRFVELDALVVANGVTPVAHCQHIAIYQPREVVAA